MIIIAFESTFIVLVIPVECQQSAAICTSMFEKQPCFEELTKGIKDPLKMWSSRASRVIRRPTGLLHIPDFGNTC